MMAGTAYSAAASSKADGWSITRGSNSSSTAWRIFLSKPSFISRSTTPPTPSTPTAAPSLTAVGLFSHRISTSPSRSRSKPSCAAIPGRSYPSPGRTENTVSPSSRSRKWAAATFSSAPMYGWKNISAVATTGASDSFLQLQKHLVCRRVLRFIWLFMIYLLGGSGYVGQAYQALLTRKGIPFRNLRRAELDRSEERRVG